MSHYVNAKTEFLVENKSCLMDALKERFPDATILENAKVRGYRGMTAPTADIVVRFRDPTKEQQGYYDLGFVKDRTGEKYEALQSGAIVKVVTESVDIKKSLAGL